MIILDEGDKLLASKDDKFAKIISLLSDVKKKWFFYSATYSQKVLDEITKLCGSFTYVHTLWNEGKL